MRGQDVDDEAAVDRRAGEEHEPERGDAERRRASGEPDPVAHHELRREADREDAHDHVAGQEGEPDLERAVAEHELEVERREEEPREHRSRPEDADARSTTATLRSRKRPSGTSGERTARLDGEEDRQQRHARRAEQAERLRSDVQPSWLPLTIA